MRNNNFQCLFTVIALVAVKNIKNNEEILLPFRSFTFK